MSNIDVENIQELPLLPLRGLTVFPYIIMHFDVGREKSIKALDQAMLNNQLIFLAAQKDARRIHLMMKFTILGQYPGKTTCKTSRDNIRVLIEGVARAEIIEFIQEEPFSW